MLRLALAWILFGIGDLISRPICRFDHLSWLYPAYNRLMLASWKIQAARERGPWATPEDR